MNAFTTRNEALDPATLSAPMLSTVSTGIDRDELMRLRLFEQFNSFWINAVNEGVPYDTVGTMSVTAAVCGLMAKHGDKVTAEFLEGVADAIRAGEFKLPLRN